MARYTLHQELDDGTLEDAFGAAETKRSARRVARACAKTSGYDVINIVVCDAEEMAVAVFPVSKGRDESPSRAG